MHVLCSSYCTNVHHPNKLFIFYLEKEQHEGEEDENEEEDSV